MAGNREGGKKVAELNKKRYGEDFYKRIGSIGGKASGKKGFAVMDSKRHIEISRLGGKNGTKAKGKKDEPSES